MASVTWAAQLGVLADELRERAVPEPEEVVEDEHLAVGRGPGADPDRRDRELRGDPRGEDVGHALEHEGEAPRVLQRVRVLQEPLRVLEVLALDAVAPHRVDGLGREAEVAHDGDLGAEDARDDRGAHHAPLELHAAGTGSDERCGVAHRVIDAGVVAHPRQVAHDERRRRRPGDGARVPRHVVDRHVQRVGVAEHRVGHRVAHQQQVHAGGVAQPRGGLVVGGHHHEGLGTARALAAPDVRGGGRRRH